MACDQTHGLMADGSQRNQKGDIDTLRLEFFHDLGYEFFLGAALRVDRAHAGKHILGDLSDDTFFLKTAQRFDWKDTVRIFARCWKVLFCEVGETNV